MLPPYSFSYRFQNPLSEYRFLYWGEDEIEGYIVIQTSNQNNSSHSWVNILDWEASNENIRRDLLLTTLQTGAFDEVNIWAATLREESKETLREAGFKFNDDIEADSYPTVLIRPIPEALQAGEWKVRGMDILEINNWSIRGAYSDGY